MKSTEPQPGIEIVPLPREKAGPFLILGVGKDATAEQIEAAWAQRVLWARQGKTSIPLGDIHWARETLRDPERRLDADAASLNLDTQAGELARLQRLYGLEPDRPSWTPADPEPPPDGPDAATLLAQLPLPPEPLEVAGLERFLDDFANESIDPWSAATDQLLPPGDA